MEGPLLEVLLYISDLCANRLLFPRTGACNISFAESWVEDCLELNFKYVDYQTLLVHVSNSSYACLTSVDYTSVGFNY